MMTENGKIKQPAKMTHDYLFRVLLEDPGRAATLLREYLPPALSARMIDEPPKLLDGTYVDENSRMTQSDRLFEVRLTDGPPVMIYTLVEHKSVPEYSTPLQLLGYLVRIWTRYAEGKAAKLSALPVIVPLVFYHGRKSWTVPQTFGEMVQSDADTAAFVPSFRYDLHDLGVGPHQKLSSDAPVRAVLTALRYVQRNDEVTVGVLTALLRDLPDGTDLERIVFRYIVEKYEVSQPVFTAALDTAKDDGGKALMGTIAETWKKEGEAKGLAAGKILGREKGLAAGKAEGLAEGQARGLAKGISEGEARGEAKSLMRLLVKRFGPLPEAVVSQIAAGSIEELDRWVDRVLDAPTLEAIFGERRDH